MKKQKKSVVPVLKRTSINKLIKKDRTGRELEKRCAQWLKRRHYELKSVKKLKFKAKYGTVEFDVWGEATFPLRIDYAIVVECKNTFVNRPMVKKFISDMKDYDDTDPEKLGRSEIKYAYMVSTKGFNKPAIQEAKSHKPKIKCFVYNTTREKFKGQM